jgi:CRISPR system Cascade subunit CasC
MLIELHMIQNHAPSNLNRDDTGSPKHCVFGGVKRARISSQCLKRSIRNAWTHSGDPELQAFLGTRTAGLLEHLADLVKRKDGKTERKAVVEAGHELLKALYVKKTRESKKTGKINTAYALFLSADEKENIEKFVLKHWDSWSEAAGKVAKIQEELKEAKPTDKQKKDLEKKQSALAGVVGQSLKDSPFSPGTMTVDVAMFGRMMADFPGRNVEAAVQVAHAISTHTMEHEFDYFTAVDDLAGGGDQDDTGAEMIGDIEFNSACYYKYFSIDTEQLEDNLSGKPPNEKATKEEKRRYEEACKTARDTVRKAIPAFIRAAVFTTPPGKQNSFAAHQLPDGILVEARQRKTPVSYANAFVKPARVKGEKDLVLAGIEQFKEHVETITTKFDLEASPRLWFCTRDIDIKGATEAKKLNDLIKKLETALKNGKDENNG